MLNFDASMYKDNIMRVRDSGRCCPHCYEPIMEKQAMVKCDTGSVYRWVDLPHTCDEIEIVECDRILNGGKRMKTAESSDNAERDGRQAAMESFEDTKPEALCPYNKDTPGNLYSRWLSGWYAEKINSRIGDILVRNKVGLM